MSSSSGIKRGLAATAIAALAVTGAPFLAGSANASSVSSTVGANNTNLYSQFSGVAGIQNDGTNTTVHLLAGGGANVAQVQFAYTPAGGTLTNIGAPVAKANGVFSLEWAPPANTYGTTVTISAIPLNAVGTSTGGTTDTQATLVNANAATVDIAGAPGQTVPVYQQPYSTAGGAGRPTAETAALGAVSGTASSTANVTLQDLTDGGPTTTATPDATSKAFTGSVDFSGYTFDTSATPVNEAVVGAKNTSDDAEVVNLTQQTIGNVTATANPASIPNNAGSTSTGTVTVTDTNNKPVDGAEVVYDANNNGTYDAGDTIEYTGPNGTASFPGLTGTNAGMAYNFYVNTTDDVNFNAATDFRRSITVTTVNQVPTTLTASSKDGSAFDINEYGNGDITVKLVDQTGAPIPNTTVSYSLADTPFTAPTTGQTAPAAKTGQVTTGADGTATVPVNFAAFETYTGASSGSYTLTTYIDRDGTPGQSAGDLVGTPLTFKAGQAALTFADSSPVTKAAGSTSTYSATLKLEDGTPLAGRVVNFTYAPGAGGDSTIAAQANQPAGTTYNSNNSATGTTDSTGTVKVAIADPSAATVSELGAQLSAATGTTPNIGDAGASAGPIVINYANSTAPAKTVITVTPAATGKPGAATGDLTVHAFVDTDGNGMQNGAEADVPGLLVNLATDHGFFTDGTTSPAPVVGAQTGGVNNLGTTTSKSTDNNGDAFVKMSIGRDSGFDDDGTVAAKVTASAGSVSGSGTQNFSSANPLNGGTVKLTKSATQANPTDPTRVGDDATYDVVATDQFGNPVGNIPVAFTTDSATATVTPNPVTTDFPTAQVDVSDTVAETVKITGTWTGAPNNTYTSTAGASTNTPTNITGTATQAFYSPSFSGSTITISHAPTGAKLPVGTAVTETVKVVDQNGNPVQGTTVQFIRTGPGTQTGDANYSPMTNANGEAFYSFAGTEAGTAQIAAVVSDDGYNVAGQTTQQRTLNDSVVFGSTPPPPPAHVKIFGNNNGAKADHFKVKVGPIAAGANVKIYVNGKKIDAGSLNGSGIARFTEKDKNGNKGTTYVVKVGKTKTSNRVQGSKTIK